MSALVRAVPERFDLITQPLYLTNQQAHGGDDRSKGFIVTLGSRIEGLTEYARPIELSKCLVQRVVVLPESLQIFRCHPRTLRTTALAVVPAFGGAA